MAEAFLNPAFTAMNGRVGGIVFFSYNERTFFRSYVRPRNPDTPAQRANRGLFRDAMKAWGALSSFDRAAFSRRARRLGMAGHNLFIARYMASHRGGEAGGDSLRNPRRRIGAFTKASLSSHIPGRSVTQTPAAGLSENARSMADLNAAPP